MTESSGHLVERAVAGYGGFGSLARRGEPSLPRPPAPAAPPASTAPPASIALAEPSAPEAAAIPLQALAAAGMMPWGRRRDLLTEEFRIAQSALLRAADAADRTREGRNLVVVTSARPGEGKSFCALNLAAGIAHYANRPTLLVDVDAKERSLSFHLGLADRPGILEVAGGKLPLAQAILPTAIPHLSVLPIGGGADRGGASAEYPLELVVARLGRAQPDAIVLLDLPPCLSRSEASAFAPLAGQVLMVVEAQSTQRSEVEAALDLVEACPSIMLLLNKVRGGGPDTFGSYGQYS